MRHMLAVATCKVLGHKRWLITPCGPDCLLTNVWDCARCGTMGIDE